RIYRIKATWTPLVVNLPKLDHALRARSSPYRVSLDRPVVQALRGSERTGCERRILHAGRSPRPLVFLHQVDAASNGNGAALGGGVAGRSDAFGMASGSAVVGRRHSA